MDTLTPEEVQVIINIMGQVSVPVVSKEADTIRVIINKLIEKQNSLKSKQ